MSPKTFHSCGYCKFSTVGTNGRVHCEHVVDVIAVKAGERGANPIWAERKYGSLGTLMTLSGVAKPSEMIGPGTNPRNMAFTDGADCQVWQSNGIR